MSWVNSLCFKSNLPCSVANDFIGLWVTTCRRWVQWLTHFRTSLCILCSISGCFCHTLLLISMHCGLLYSWWVWWIAHHNLKQSSLSPSFCGLFFMLILFISMHFGLPDGEFSALCTFNQAQCLVHFVACPFYTLLLTSTHCGLLGGGFSEIVHFIYQNFHVLFILFFFPPLFSLCHLNVNY